MISFEELLQKSRGDAQIPEWTLCLDPGETTGFAIFNKQHLVREGHLRTVEDGKILWYEIHDLISVTEPFDQIVCEDYRVYQHKLDRHSFSPVLTLRLIGGIDHLAWKNHIPIHYQMAAQAKGFVTDDKLKNWGFWKDGMKHARDAIRHGCYFLLFHKRGQDI